MACNKIWIDAPPDEVFAHLEDTSAYPQWVVGARAVRDSDPAWPLPDSDFRPEMGAGPVGAQATTQVVESEGKSRLRLAARSSFGSADVTIDVEPRDGGAVVILREEIRHPHHLRRLMDPLLHARNAESLRRLKALVEQGAGPANFVAGLGALRAVEGWLDRGDYREVVRSAKTCYVAVAAPSGPHVTPVAFTAAAGRIWVVVDKGTVKANAVERHPEVGILVRGRGGSALVTGRGQILDPWRPWEWPARLADAALAMPALLVYGRRNALRLARYAARDPLNIARLRPSNRVLVAVTPSRTALVRDGSIVDRDGPWPDTGLRPGSPPSDDELEHDRTRGLPAGTAALVREAGAEVAVGFDTPDGPAALPGVWNPEANSASVPIDVLAMIGAADGSAACICFDVEEGGDLQNKKGVVVRGRARVTAGSESATVEVAERKVSYWAGSDGGTV